MTDLTKLHTKVLLKMLNGSRKIGWWRAEDFTDTDWENLREYRESIKAELAKRPHIPNKNESRKIRQEAAKRRR